MRWLLRCALALLVTLPLLAIAALLLAVDDQPTLKRQLALTPAAVERARSLLSGNDPRRMAAGILRTINVPQEDLDLATNYLVNHYLGGASEIALHDGKATIQASVALPSNPFGRFANVKATLRETPTLPRFEQLCVGRLPVPAFLGNALLDFTMARLLASPDYGAAAAVIRRVRSDDGVLSVVFQWNDAVPGQLKSALVGSRDQARWRSYQERLVQLTRAYGASPFMRFDQLLGPMMELVQQRSVDGEPIAESRAALLVLAFYINGKSLATLVPAARNWPVAPPRRVTLSGRTDFPQHFTVSAALAATAGSPLSDVVGLYKELDDARVGNGFSFNDFAADRAGTRFGELAVSGRAGLARIGRMAAAGFQESDIMPEVGDLPEFLSPVAFERRFGGVGQPPYRQMVGEIERRIAALPLYR